MSFTCSCLNKGQSHPTWNYPTYPCFNISDPDFLPIYWWLLCHPQSPITNKKHRKNITSNSEDLAWFTTHSIRVGACVLLHETKQMLHFIKAYLCCCSDTYLMYLHNTPKLTLLHTQAMNNSTHLYNIHREWQSFAVI